MERNQWRRALSMGLAGIIISAAIPLTAAASSRQLGRVVMDRVYLRTAPSVNAEDRGIFTQGTQVYVNGEQDGWYEIEFGTLTGYIREDLLEPVAKGSVQTHQEEPDQEYDTTTWLKQGDLGDKVISLQVALKNKGYFFAPITGTFGSLTRVAVADFQRMNGLREDGIAGTETLELLYLGKFPSASNTERTASSSTAGSTQSSSSSAQGTETKQAGNVELADWFSVVEEAFPRGATATVTDVKTGISFNVTRQGGYNHADIVPVTPEDTAKFKQVYGGKWSWERRAAWVTTSGGRTFAASINGMPHGKTTNPYNEMNGHTCIHFLNSRTHGTNKVDGDHQAAVQSAFDAAK